MSALVGLVCAFFAGLGAVSWLMHVFDNAQALLQATAAQTRPRKDSVLEGGGMVQGVSDAAECGEGEAVR